MLHRRRNRLKALAAKEAAGANLWTDKFDEAARNKIIFAWTDAIDRHNLHEACSLARGLILRDEGLVFLLRQNMDAADDLLNYLATCPDDMVPTVVEAMARVCNDQSIAYRFHRYDMAETFNTRVAVVLREHRISYDLISGEMIEFSSREMHEAVVVPVLRLIAGRPDLAAAERAYHEALDEIAKGKPGDAITDAGTALQETLTALGCDGNALGPLIKSDRSKGMLGAHDAPMADAVDKLLNWVSADRSQMGDAHSASNAKVEDAWLIVHVVGALILRLAAGSPRQ